MNTRPADEAPIDTSLSHHMEERALAIALDKAATAAQRSRIVQLQALRATLLQQRARFSQEATAKRHARGEIYSKARVAAINAMGPSLQDLERDIRSLYGSQPDADAVLMAHARTHFANVLMSQRLLLSSHTPDIVDAARALQQHEEAFAVAWAAAVGDTAFPSELRRLQREALRQLRTSTRPMLLLTWPDCTAFDDGDALALGKAWNRLDELAQRLGVERLSDFIALPDEGESAGVPVLRLLPSIEALIAALQGPGHSVPSKRAVLAALAKARNALQRLGPDGSACFEVDL